MNRLSSRAWCEKPNTVPPSATVTWFSASSFLLDLPATVRLFQPEPAHRLLKSRHIPIRIFIFHCYMIIYVIIIYLRSVIIHLSCKWNVLLSTRSLCLQSCMTSLNYRVRIWFGIVCTFDLFLLVYVLHSVYHKYTRESWIDQNDTSVGQRNFWFPDRNGTHDLQNTWRAFYPLFYENSG